MAGSPEFLTNLGARLKSPAVLAGIGVGVLVIVAGGFAAMKFMGNHDAATATATARRPATSVVSAQHTVAHATTGQVTANAVPVQAVAAPVADAPVVRAVPQNVAPVAVSQAHLDDHVTYQYNALGRRDPFQSLVDGQFVGADMGGDAPPDPGGIKVVGIVWGANDQFALVEDVNGNSFVLRKGDKVQNGVVEGLKRDGVIVNITAEGQSQTVVIPLVRKGDQNAR